MNIYTGYVYLWYDTKAKFFYLGGHKGRIEDSYICSNAMMLRAYKKRPETFKFKVLQYIYGDNKDLREAEQRWLNMIKDQELYWTPNIRNNTVKYYNQKKHSGGGNGRANKGKIRNKSNWNKGYSKTEIELRRMGLLSFIPFDIPKPKKKTNDTIIKPQKPKRIKRLLDKQCPICDVNFKAHIEKQKTCSQLCYAKFSIKYGTTRGPKKGTPAWNKGFPNPQAKINGIKSALKQSQTVTGRKKKIRDDGTWTWVYPNK